MKITIDGKVCEVSFWGFFKGYILSQLLVYGVLILIFFLIGVFIA